MFFIPEITQKFNISTFSLPIKLCTIFTSLKVVSTVAGKEVLGIFLYFWIKDKEDLFLCPNHIKRK